MSAPFDTAARLTNLLDTPRSMSQLIEILTCLLRADLPEHVNQASADALDALTDLQAEILGVL